MATELLFSALLALVLPTDAKTNEVNVFKAWSFQIPFHVSPETKDSIAELRLFVSADEGKTWKKVAAAKPEQESFTFVAPWNGTFWFTLQTVKKNNEREPEDVKSAPPGQKMLVQAVQPLKPAQRKALHHAAGFPAVSLNGQIDWPGLFFEDVRSDKATNSPDLSKTGLAEANDAEQSYRRGRLYAANHQQTRAADAYRKAIDLARKGAKTHPHNGQLLINLGTYLAVSENEEAEAVFRQAVKVAPADWRCWAALGNYLLCRACRDCSGPEWTDRARRAAGLPPATRPSPRKPSPDELGQAEKLLAESRVCFDKAVAAAPQELQTYKLRVTARCTDSSIKSFLRALRGDQLDPMAAWWAAFVSPECASDLKQISKLAPNDPAAIAAAVLVDAYSHVPGARIDQGERLWESLPQQGLPYVRSGMARLKRLTESENAAIAAGAWQMLAQLQAFVLGDYRAATTSCRRAIALDSSREPVWDLFTLLVMDNNKAAAALCEERLKVHASPRNHMLLASAYERLGQLDKAEEHVRAVLKLAPDDALSNLCLAALALRRDDDPTALTRAAEALQRAANASDRLPSENWADYVVSTAVFNALLGDVDSSRVAVKAALDREPNHSHAKAVLAALDGKTGSK